MKFEALFLFLGEFEVKKLGLALGTFLPLVLLASEPPWNGLVSLGFGLLDTSLLTVFFVEFTGLAAWVFERTGLLGMVLFGLFAATVLDLIGLFGSGLFLRGLLVALRRGLFDL